MNREAPGTTEAAARTTAAPRTQQRPSQHRRLQTPVQPSEKASEAQDIPHLKEAREFARQMTIAVKNLELYPSYGRVVRESLEKLHSFAEETLGALGILRLEVTHEELRFQGNAVYEEPEPSKSIAYRLYRDGVREVSFHPGLPLEELRDFLVCIKDARRIDEEDDDFVTMHWEKDAQRIGLRLAEELLSPEGLLSVPKPRSLLKQLPLRRFLDASARRQDGSRSEEEAPSSELSEPERQKLRDCVAAEPAYAPTADLNDILLHVLAHAREPEVRSRQLMMARSIIASAVERLEFGEAARLIERFSSGSLPESPEHCRREIQEMLGTFAEPEALAALETYLKESDRLKPDHPIFRLMQALPNPAPVRLCSFLKYEKHAAGVVKVLVQRAAGNLEEYAKYLDHREPAVVRGMIAVLLEADKEGAVQRIAKALRHPSESVRLSCARAILEKGDSRCAPLLLRLLEESSPQLLNLALEFFGKVQYPEAFEKLRRLAQSRSFRGLDERRKRLCFSAMLKSSERKTFDFLEKNVLWWPFPFTKASRERKAAALEALSLVATERSRKILERWAARKRSGLSKVAERSLRTMALLEKQSQGESAQAPTKPEVEHA